MGKKIYILIYLLCVTALLSCSEIFEEPIDEEKVALLSPGNHFETSIYLQEFLWEAVEDALYYRLQIASPTFDSAAFYAVDTLVELTHFEITLKPGQYQWRVRAQNGSTMTAYSTRNLVVHPSSISEQSVQLLSPQDQLVTKNGQVLFEWNALFGATKYRIQLDTANFSDETMIVYDNTIPGTRLTFTINEENVYQWRVRAENDTASSIWSPIRILTLDQSPPPVPVQVSPGNNQRVEKPVSLQWNASAGAVNYRLAVYKSDSATLYNNDFPVIVKGNTYSFDLGESNERVFWRVSAIDAAGNESEYSGLRNFMID